MQALFKKKGSIPSLLRIVFWHKKNFSIGFLKMKNIYFMKYVLFEMGYQIIGLHI